MLLNHQSYEVFLGQTMTDISNNRSRIINAFIKQTGINLSEDKFLDNFLIEDPIRQTSVLPRKNTTINVVAKLDSEFFGIRRVWYNRIHVTELGRIEVTRTTETKISQLLNQINTRYNLFITEYDIINFDLIPSQVGTFPIILPINPKSLMFYDGNFIQTADNLPLPPIINWPNGMLLNSYCVNSSRMGVFSNGAGGTTVSLLQENCPECNYVPVVDIFLVIDGGNASTEFLESWQTAGTQGAG